MKLEGKVAIITGAGSGMGAEEAKMFAAEGARVVITDINAEACRKVADEIGEAAIAIEHDVANEEGWGVVVATTLEKFGKIDILVNNDGLTKADTFDHPDAVVMRRMLDVNLVGSFLGMTSTRDAMRTHGRGVEVNLASGLASPSISL